MPFLQPPPWAGKPVRWLDKPDYYDWALEELEAHPFCRKALGYVDSEWISIALGLAEPYLVNSCAEIVYVPGMGRSRVGADHG